MRGFATITPDERLTKAREILRETGLRLLLVVDPIEKKRLLGVVYRLDILNVTSTRTNMLVRDVMNIPPVVVEIDEDPLLAVKRMLDADEWYSPVISGNELKGLLGLESIIWYYLKRKPEKLEDPIESKYTKNPEVIREDDDVGRVWRLMLKHKYAGFPVVSRDGRLIGAITQYDLLKHGFARPQLESEGSPRRVKVREIFSTPAISVSLESTFREVAELMIKRNIGRVFVAESGRLVGVVDREDVARHILSRS